MPVNAAITPVPHPPAHWSLVDLGLGSPLQGAVAWLLLPWLWVPSPKGRCRVADVDQGVTLSTPHYLLLYRSAEPHLRDVGPACSGFYFGGGNPPAFLGNQGDIGASLSGRSGISCCISSLRPHELWQGHCGHSGPRAPPPLVAPEQRRAGLSLLQPLHSEDFLGCLRCLSGV